MMGRIFAPSSTAEAELEGRLGDWRQPSNDAYRRLSGPTDPVDPAGVIVPRDTSQEPPANFAGVLDPVYRFVETDTDETAEERWGPD